MNRMHTLIALAATAAVSFGVAAQTDGGTNAMSNTDRAEFTKLVYQRNKLYNQLKLAGDMKDDNQTRWVQNQLDVVERRLSDMSRRSGVAIPGRPVTRTMPVTAAPVTKPTATSTMPPIPGTIAPTPSQRAEFNKLVMRRNKLHVQLTQLDEQASEMIKRGENAVVVHAQQVSVQDELDLVELQLAIMSTRYNLDVPPVPGRDPLPAGGVAQSDDAANRGLDKAFARGRERAVKKLADDTDEFLGSIDFNGFLHD